MMEVGVVLDREGQPLYWHEPPGRTSVVLPDSRTLWDVLWQNRERVGGFAHSHPGYGVPGPSHEDLTTFAAIEAALGRRLNWWIISQDERVLLHWVAEEAGYVGRSVPWFTPAWLSGLRLRSYGKDSVS